MNISELKTGLYFTLPEKNIEKTRDIGNTYDLNDYHNYRFELYTPIKYENNWYMINTYYFPKLKYPNMERCIRDINNKQEDAYENAALTRFPCKIKLTDESLKLFEFSFDLRNYKIIDLEDIKDYQREDIKFVSLFNMGSFWPKFIAITKTETKKDPKAMQIRITEQLAKYTQLLPYNKHVIAQTIRELDAIENADLTLNNEIKERLAKIKSCYEEIMNLDFEWLDPEIGTIKDEKKKKFLNQ